MHRSLSAAEQLSKAGYGTLAWVNGGLDTAKKPDLPVKNADDLRYGGIGGFSEALGWTDVQREKSAGFMGGSFGPIKVVSYTLKHFMYCTVLYCNTVHITGQSQWLCQYGRGFWWTDVQHKKIAGFMGGSFGPIEVMSCCMLLYYLTKPHTIGARGSLSKVLGWTKVQHRKSVGAYGGLI